MSSGHDFQKGWRTDGVFLCLPFAFLLCFFIDDGQQLNDLGALGRRQEITNDMSCKQEVKKALSVI